MAVRYHWKTAALLIAVSKEIFRSTGKIKPVCFSASASYSSHLLPNSQTSVVIVATISQKPTPLPTTAAATEKSSWSNDATIIICQAFPLKNDRHALLLSWSKRPNPDWFARRLLTPVELVGCCLRAMGEFAYCMLALERATAPHKQSALGN